MANTKVLLWLKYQKMPKFMQIKFLPEQKDIGKLSLEKNCAKEENWWLFSKLFKMCFGLHLRGFSRTYSIDRNEKRPQAQWNSISLHKIIINTTQWILLTKVESRSTFLLNKNRFHVLIRINDLSSAFHCASDERIQMQAMM